MNIFTIGPGLKHYLCFPVVSGGILWIPPAPGCSNKLMMGNRSPDNDLAYSLTYHRSCLVDGVHRH